MMQDWTWQCKCGKWVAPYEIHGEACYGIEVAKPYDGPVHFIDKLIGWGVALLIIALGVIMFLGGWL